MDLTYERKNVLKEIDEKELQKEKTRFTQVLSFDWAEPDFTEVKL